MAAIDFLLLLCSLLLFGLPAITDHLVQQQEQANETSSMTSAASLVLVQMVSKVYQAYYETTTQLSLFSLQIPWTYSIGMIAQTASIYITVVVTIERWLAVCYPLMSRSVCSRGTKKIE